VRITIDAHKVMDLLHGSFRQLVDLLESPEEAAIDRRLQRRAAAR
jgi:hypothetical protein